MKRKDFLRGIGLAGAGSMLTGKVSSSARSLDNGPLPPNCTLIPAETAGPFPLDLTENQVFFRQDVREDRTGVLLHQKIKIIGLENCLPMPNVRVNIWACDKDGLYSGYGAETGKTYMRGYQITDANGEVDFISILPGWYNGRICHIHFQAYVSSVYAAISQLTYPIAEKNAIYAANPSLYTKGLDPLSFNNDGVFADGYAYQLATLTANPDTGGYDSYLEVTIQGSGLTSLAKAEPETGGQFKLYQNFPNPYTEATSIAFDMLQSGDAFLEIWSLSGKKMVELSKNGLNPGRYTFDIDTSSLGIPAANYAYQLRVESRSGIFRQTKLMTRG
jgi:protocatechuate 3,4-dioxygenase beta subunit